MPAFTDVQSYNYWSRTTYADNTDNEWIVDLNYGFVNYDDNFYSYYVWPVRAGQ